MAGAPYKENVTTVRQLLELLYGTSFFTEPVESNYTVTTAAQAIGQTIRQSTKKFISNTGSTNIAVGFSPTLTIAQGTLLLPGAAVEFDWYYDGDLLMRQLYAISSGSGGTLYVLERCLEGV